MKTEELKRQITNSLLNLGYSRDDVAKTLKAKGISGKRIKPLFCPIANYITSTLPPDMRSVVSQHSFGVIAQNGSRYRLLFDCFKPLHPELGPVWEFIEAFDNGMFPELEQKE